MVTYKISFRPDKSRSLRRKATAYLVITGSRSLFLDEALFNHFRIDALPLSDAEKNAELLKLNKRIPDIEIIVEKEPGRIIHSEEHLKKNYIAFEEKFPEAWEISSDTATITGLLSYKAGCTWGGRTWTAWFSPEVPVSDGPYKFSGLPGLITKLESGDGDYVFTLSDLKRVTADEVKLKLPGYKLLSKEKFKEMQQMLIDNPLARYEGSNMTVIMDGREQTPEELKIRFRKELLDRNLIEKE